MALKIKKDPNVWFDLATDSDIKFLIKPFSFLYLTKIPTETTYNPETLRETFMNSLIDWKGILDEDGKPLKCNAENKIRLLEQSYDTVMFVVLKSYELNKQKDEEVKN